MFVEILPDLWLGDENSIQDLVFLNEKKISCIINCTKYLDFNPNYHNEYNIRINMDQYRDNVKILFKINETVEAIHNFLNQGKAVLIFCKDGKQNSSTIMAAYIIKYGKVSLGQSIEYLRSKFPDSFTPNIDFSILLHTFSNKIKNAAKNNFF